MRKQYLLIFIAILISSNVRSASTVGDSSALAAYLSSIKKMVEEGELYLTGRPLTSIDASMIIVACRKHLEDCLKTDAGACMPKLTRVLLPDTALEHEHFTQIFSVAMISGAQVIDLSKNKLNDRSIHRLVALLLNESLRELNLADNMLSAELKEYLMLLNTKERTTPVILTL